MNMGEREFKTYADSGVNIKEDDDFSGIMKKFAKTTSENIPYDIKDNIIYLRSDLAIVLATDGIGTNIIDAELMEDHSTMGSKLIGMTMDDIAIIGAEPIAGANYLAMSVTDKELGMELGATLKKYADKAGVAIVAGEFAKVPPIIKNKYDWAGFGVGLLNPDRLITGKNVREGDIVFSINAKNIRSNGLTLSRGILKGKYGEKWYKEPFDDKLIWGQKIIEESDIFTPAIVEMTGGYDKERKVDILSMSNITGGGPLKRLNELVEVVGLGVLVENAPEVPKDMLELQRLGPVDDQEAYSTWNMGIGVAGIVREIYQFRNVEAIAKEFDFVAQEIGVVTSRPEIEIVSKGYHTPGDVIVSKKN